VELRKVWAWIIGNWFHFGNRMCSILAAILPHKELTTLLPHLNGKTISVLLNNGQITEARA